jgi:rhodanese-related sulfurtransferase
MNKKIAMWIVVAAFICGVAFFNGSLNITASAAESRAQTQILKDVTPQEADSLIQKNKDNPNFVILDVRTPEEFRGGHINSAVNRNYNSPTFKNDLNGLDKTKAYLIYCRTSGRSRAAFTMMKDLGFQEVYHMLGGIVRWMSEGLPTTK